MKLTWRHSNGYKHIPQIPQDSIPLQWRHNGRDGVSNHQPHDCLLNRLFGRRSNISKLRVTGLCVWNWPGTGEFPAQMASNAENVSIWWRHHARQFCKQRLFKKIILGYHQCCCRFSQGFLFINNLRAHNPSLVKAGVVFMWTTMIRFYTQPSTLIMWIFVVRY